MPKLCEYCGSPLKDGAKFCPECGAPAKEDTRPETPARSRPAGKIVVSRQMVTPQIEKSSGGGASASGGAAAGKDGAKKKKKHRGVSFFLAAAILFGFWFAGFRYPGFMKNLSIPGGISLPSFGGGKGGEIKSPDSLSFGKFETVGISPDNPIAEFRNGVIVDFGEEGLLADGKMSVRESKVTGMDVYKCKAYDFRLGDSEHTDLPMLTKVTLPIEKGWDAEEVSVRCWDEELEMWVPVYSETDVSAGTITFWPEHFSSYAAFVSGMKEKKSLAAFEDRPLYRYLTDKPDANSPVYLDELALAARMKKRRTPEEILSTSWLGKGNKAAVTSALGCSAIVSVSGLGGEKVDIGSFSGMDPGTAGDVSDYAAGGLALMGEIESDLSKDLGNFGQAATIAQLMYSYYKTGSITETLKENWDSIAKMAMDYALEYYGYSTAAVSSVVAILWVAYISGKKLSEKISLAYHLGAESDVEFGYRFFTHNYVAMNSKTGRSSIRYAPGGATNVWEATKMTTDLFEADEVRLLAVSGDLIGKVTNDVATIRTGCEIEWGVYLRNITCGASLSDPEAMMRRIERSIDDYCSAFWKLDANTKRKYLAEQAASFGTSKKLSEVWKEPSESDKQKMIDKMKTAIYASNKKVIEDLLAKSYYTMMNNAFKEASKLEKLFNEKMTFTLTDVTVSDFSKSKFAKSDITIRQDAFKKDDFRFTKANGYTVTCTRYAWHLARNAGGYPRTLDIKGRWSDDSGTFDFSYLLPKTVIYVKSEDDETKPVEQVPDKGDGHDHNEVIDLMIHVDFMDSIVGGNSEDQPHATLKFNNGTFVLNVPAQEREGWYHAFKEGSTTEYEKNQKLMEASQNAWQLTGQLESMYMEKTPAGVYIRKIVALDDTMEMSPGQITLKKTEWHDWDPYDWSYSLEYKITPEKISISWYETIDAEIKRFSVKVEGSAQKSYRNSSGEDKTETVDWDGTLVFYPVSSSTDFKMPNGNWYADEEMYKWDWLGDLAAWLDGY